MSWIALSLISAVLLGLYDIAKKASVRDNAVPAVLFVNVLTAALIWLPFILFAVVSRHDAAGHGIPDALRQVALLSPLGHILLFAKSILVGVSWMCAFFALKHLPISIAAPIRSTSPLWIVFIAVFLLSERPSAIQWAGMLMVIGAFVVFSRVSIDEGVRFDRDRWVLLMVAATILGSCSALFDKFLLQTMKIPALVVQAWFSVYLVPVMLPLAMHWYFSSRRTEPFQWRWTIPMIAVGLLAADLAYFFAVQQPDALIAVVSPLRRTSLVVAFLYGVLVLGEKRPGSKAVCIFVLLIGVFLLSI